MNINSQPVNILLVDDDEINNFISIKLIKKTVLNTEIASCLNGKFAIDQLLSRNIGDLPDIIFLDINMPIMNGWEFLDEFERLRIDPHRKIKIFIISSSVFSNDINKAKSYPSVVDFISKPLDMEKISEVFERMLVAK